MGRTPIILQPPPPEDGSIGGLLNLSPELEKLLFGNNIDMSPKEFLNHAETSYQERVDYHIKQYRAMVYMIGLLAGVVDEYEGISRDEFICPSSYFYGHWSCLFNGVF